MATKSLYVGNLPYEVTEDDLRNLFAEFGPVEEVRVIEGKGFGFVDLPEEKAAEATEAVNGREYQGRVLRVDEARPRRERGERGGGFGDRGGGRRRW
jgi:RNA recognition motif-containing protein